MNQDGKIRVGFFFDGGEGGGVVEYVRLLLQNIDRDAFYVVGFFLGDGPSHDTLKRYFDKTVILTGGRLVNYGSGRGKLQKIRLNTKKMFIAFKGAVLLARGMRKHKIQVLDVNYFPHHILAGIACRLTSTPCVWHWHGATVSSGMRGKAVAFGTRFFCDVIVPISLFVEKSLPAVARKKSKVVYNGVDVNRVVNAAANGHLRHLAGVQEHMPLIAILGTISPLKGHAYFVKAADLVLKELPDARFVIIGRESAAQKKRIGFEEQLKADVQQLNRQHEILFLGQVPNAAQYLSECTVVCTPSIPYRNFLGEGFGLAAAEAMAAGVPVIATDIGSFPEIIENDKNGVLAEPEDAQALAHAILSLLRDEPRRRRIGLAAQHHIVQHFDVKFTTTKMERIYQRLL
ncbi:glycosyltransferase family 4 protein [Chitinophaga sp.]|uniref:glycosyltransferase family 4 protein n=1 Tax=Chitinophaga sp. TaxID=1869181 RepID=UPI002D7EE10E|nr:glycosyltransferase family 4 protein [Chitinophaga sp.]